MCSVFFIASARMDGYDALTYTTSTSSNYRDHQGLLQHPAPRNISSANASLIHRYVNVQYVQPLWPTVMRKYRICS
jgi:hypothetical protein